MPQTLKKVALVGKYDNLAIAGSVERLAGFLAGQGYQVVLASQMPEVEEKSGDQHAKLSELASSVDVVIVLGGTAPCFPSPAAWRLTRCR